MGPGVPMLSTGRGIISWFGGFLGHFPGDEPTDVLRSPCCAAPAPAFTSPIPPSLFPFAPFSFPAESPVPHCGGGGGLFSSIVCKAIQMYFLVYVLLIFLFSELSSASVPASV